MRGIFSPRLQRIVRRPATSGETQSTGQPRIIADERCNSLLIYATRQDMQRMKEAISRLDIALTRVLIEAVILEIPASGSNGLGLSYRAGSTQSTNDSSLGAGALSRSNLVSINPFAPVAGTNALASQPSGFGYWPSQALTSIDDNRPGQ